MHLLVNELKKDGILDKAMFGLYLTDTNADSKIHFGGYDLRIVEEAKKEFGDQGTEDGIFWMKINSYDHWQVNLYQAEFNDYSV
eukprot:CAMPEP_0170486476 /NCGR_PEP_ID=MMETSP0208-20121228/5488_1 /TAXON_ID=197538 /ORGANISM="Strombidium inclinatum, Strain S3" /LENGTH=83 /DNA_ID=CAMNT_0010760433 /DNA_START=857 /DNA_END=1108 /DNA_ORIENTATION=+